MEVRFEDYLIRTDNALLQIETIHKFLAASYWANKLALPGLLPIGNDLLVL